MGWLLIGIGVVSAVASFVKTPNAYRDTWPILAAGVALIVLGIVVLNAENRKYAVAGYCGNVDCRALTEIV
jgi:uncharacterized membrane protein HdeD (DUF308 family)